MVKHRPEHDNLLVVLREHCANRCFGELVHEALFL